MSASTIIQAKHLTKRVNIRGHQLTILEDINLTIKSSETVAIMGVSGSGKSTLLSLLAGLDQASDGDVIINQQHLSQLDEDERAALRAKNLSFIFQNFQLIPSQTALENVMLPLELNHYSNVHQRACYWLNKVGLSNRYNHLPLQLSGGEQQRVAIARAFAIEPNILLADEPTGNLDKKTAIEVINCLFQLNRQKQTTMIIVTHDDNIAKLCQRTITLDGGRLSNANL